MTDVASVLSTQYHQSASEYLVSSVAEHLPISLVAYYQQEKTKWYEELSK
ncbi:MAG: hypothetical protein LBO09_03545 [Candidatus Peribacteria bacterium]|nr:hypothetical protein [Candidatus Peribacteria bacterium]